MTAPVFVCSRSLRLDTPMEETTEQGHRGSVAISSKLTDMNHFGQGRTLTPKKHTSTGLP